MYLTGLWSDCLDNQSGVYVPVVADFIYFFRSSPLSQLFTLSFSLHIKTRFRGQKPNTFFHLRETNKQSDRPTQDKQTKSNKQTKQHYHHHHPHQHHHHHHQQQQPQLQQQQQQKQQINLQLQTASKQVPKARAQTRADVSQTRITCVPEGPLAITHSN